MHKFLFIFCSLVLLDNQLVAQSPGDILFYKKAAGSGYNPVYLTPSNNKTLGFNGSGTLSLSSPFSGAFPDLSANPFSTDGTNATINGTLTGNVFTGPGDSLTLTGGATSLTVDGSGLSIADVGLIITPTGAWHGTQIADGYIASATTWNAKQSALTFSTGLTNSGGTITANAVNLAASGSGGVTGLLANANLAHSSITIAGASTNLGDSITAGSILDSISTTQGTILYRGASGWSALAPGTSGTFLETQGASANPQWASATTTPGGSSGNAQYNNGGALEGFTGETITSGALSAVSITGVNNTTPFTLAAGSVTGMGTTPFFSLTGTWNTSATPTALLVNITDTAESGGGLLADFRTNLYDCFSISTVSVGGGAGGVTAGSYTIRSSNNQTLWIFGDAPSIRGASGMTMSWGSSSISPGNDSGTLTEDAANIFAFKNISTASQMAVRIYDGGGNYAEISQTLKVKTQSNGKAGTFTLTSGSVTVSNTSVTANSVIICTVKSASGTRAGTPDIVPTAGTGFTATGGGSDASTYNYVILETY